MKIFKKVNRGLVLTLAILTIVIVYICVLTLKHNNLEKESAVFLTSFFKADEEWRSIPEEFRKDADAYVKSIEKEARAYFADERVYEYYINDAILSQYKSNKFLKQEECEYSMFESYESNYDGELLRVRVFVEIGGETEQFFATDNLDITLKESDTGLKIVSFARPFAGEYGEYITIG